MSEIVSCAALVWQIIKHECGRTPEEVLKSFHTIVHIDGFVANPLVHWLGSYMRSPRGGTNNPQKQLVDVNFYWRFLLRYLFLCPFRPSSLKCSARAIPRLQSCTVLTVLTSRSLHVIRLRRHVEHTFCDIWTEQCTWSFTITWLATL